jgi:membrane-associated phospholipid phosphatase
LTAISPRPAERSGAAAAFFGAVLLPLAVLCALAVAVTVGGGIGWDTEVLRFAERHYQAPIVDPLDVGLRISLGLAAAFTAGVVIVLLVRGRRRHALFWALAIGGVAVLDAPLKHLFARAALGGPRGAYSFPSGNAMVSAAVVAAVILSSSASSRPRRLAATLPLLVAYGAATVYAWWHYPSDVIGGWCIGLAWVTALWLALHLRVRAPDPPSE